MGRERAADRGDVDRRRLQGNPGVGGWGAWMRYGAHERELFGGEALTTNNRMELTAVIEGLRALDQAVRRRRCTSTRST